MEKISKITQVSEKIKIDKEILLAMPINNEKNIIKYEQKISELLKEYNGYKNDILKKLEERYLEETKIEENAEINNLEKRINTIDNTLYLFNKYKNPYEKMQLDRNIYKLGKFYDKSVDNVNVEILESINKFKEIGIDLKLNDFEYSIYVREYMKVFLEELPNIKSEKLKEKFEELYWKCPDIIIHIKLNIRTIYFKNEKYIKKDYENKRNLLLEKWKREPKNIIETYKDLILKRDILVKKSKKRIIEDFINGKKNIKNYEENKIIKELKNICMPEKIENEEELKENISNFLFSLYEYENYLEFKFLIDDIKEHYKQKEEYKKSYKMTKRKIDNLEKKREKINKKIIKTSIFLKNNESSNEIIKQNQIIIELNELYKELDINSCYSKISYDLKDNSTLYEALELALSSYYYLNKLIINNQKEIEEKEIEEKIKKLETFLKSPYTNIVKNIKIIEEKDIAQIIKDRYKLCDFIIEKEDFNEENIEDLTIKLKTIEEYFNMKEKNIKEKKIKELLNIKNILKNAKK